MVDPSGFISMVAYANPTYPSSSSSSLQAAKHDLKLRTIWYHTAERKAKVEKEQAEAQNERAKKQGQREKEGPLISTHEIKGLAPGLSRLANMATASADRFFKDKGAVHVRSMETDDYLTHYIVKEFADAEVETLKEVGVVIEEWLSQGCRNGGEEDHVTESGEIAEAAGSGLGLDAEGKEEGGEKLGRRGVEGTKFCIACRAVLPARAKFCSTCGEAQE